MARESMPLALRAFRDDGHPGRESYAQLFRYFVDGWARRRTPLGALARYPGWRSWSDRRAEELEGFARVVPLLGAWVRGGRQRTLTLDNGDTLDLCDAVRRGMLAGTDPSGPEYWGRIGTKDQRAVEAADVALALWLLREPVWEEMAGPERAQVAAWLVQMNEAQVYDSNWLLFVMLVLTVLEQLGVPVPDSSARRRYARVKEFYRGDGWFQDGEKGSFDYYNAWGFHYQLYWCEQVDSRWNDDGFLSDARRAFLKNYKYLIGPHGVPLLGRSQCYRLAVAAPQVFGHTSCPEEVSAGQARRALDATWRYFIQQGALRNGTVTQGYFHADQRILDNYSGPASCLWSLRSLIPAFYFPDDAPFWTAEPEPLPVERADYDLVVGATGWRIRGERETGEITVEVPDPLPESQTRLVGYGLVSRILGMVYKSPHRPENYAAKYRRQIYSSATPFCVK